MELFIFASVLMFLSMAILGIGVLFFNAKTSQTACGVIPSDKLPPRVSNKKCASGEVGLCPMEDKTGALKIQVMSKINR